MQIQYRRSILSLVCVPLIYMGIACQIMESKELVYPLFADAAPAKGPNAPTSAPAAFDDKTNGVENQGAFDDDKKNFANVEDAGDGLGPVYNANNCAVCHQNPVTGTASQVTVIRAGHLDLKKHEFVEPAGGSLIFQRAVNASIQAVVSPNNEVRSLRLATNIAGDGYVECIPDEAIRQVQLAQPKSMQGAILLVPVAVAADGKGGFTFVERIGRFGWKCQDASLLNFSAGAYVNEMGITSPLQQKENSSNGRPVDDYDGKKPDPEDPALADHPFGKDVESFTRFMRSLKAPPTEEKIADAMAVERGRALFMDNNKTGCAICHVPSWTTVPVGTAIGDFKVPVELGNKTIRPYSDFMLHDIGTGDGIVQTQHAQRPPHGCEVKENIRYSTIEVGEKVHRVLTDMYTYYEDDKGADGTADKKRDKQRVMRSSLVSTAYLIRTAPLWGLRTRPQMMHDGLSLTIDEAIRRHEKQADRAERNYSRKLTPAERNDLLAYLGTL